MRRAFAGLLAGAVAATAAAALPAAATALPADRAYELVSPFENRAISFDNGGWASPDGDHAVMLSLGDIAGIRVASREATGWRTRRVSLVAPGASLSSISALVDAAPDLSRALVAHGVPGPTLYENDQLKLREADGSWTTVGEGVRTRGVSEDLSRVVVVPHFYAGSSTYADPYPEVPSRSRVYRWDDGAVESIGDDAPAIAACGADVADGAGLHTNDQSGVSPDAETVVLLSRACTDNGVDRRAHVHVWRDGETVDVSEPVAGADADAAYVGNAVDGSAVFFTTAAQLEAADANGVVDLYRYDVESGQLTRPSAAATAGGDPVADAISSDDGDAAWLVTDTDAGQTLHAWSQGGAAVPVEDVPAASIAFVPEASTGYAQTQLTPDGDTIAFRASQPMGGYDGANLDQIMRATREDGIACISCLPDGRGVSTVSFGAAPTDLRWSQQRMADDGEQIAFEANGPLVPEDENERADVYLWHDGEVSLISSGTDGREAALAGVTPRGDVFFRTVANQLPWVEDDHFKLYVARIGGGFPAPQSPLPGCTADDCQAPPRAQDPPGPPHGSESDRGPGDADDPQRSWTADPAVRLGSVSAAAKRRLAAGRAIGLKVRSTASGRVTATVRMKVGRRWVRVDGAARTLKRAGTVTLNVRLSRQARRALARRGRLSVRIDVAHARGVRDVRASFVLKTTAGRRAHA